MAIEAQWKPHVGKVSVTIELVGFELKPDELTESLGVQPTFTDCTHVPAAFTAAGLVGAKDYGTWCYDTASHVSSREVGEHLRHLLRLFRPLRSQIEELRPRPAVCVRVHYESIIAGSGGAAPQIDADCIVGLADLGATLFVEVIKIDEVDDA